MIGIRWWSVGRAAGTILVLGLGACSDSGAPTDDTIPSAEAADIGDAVADEGEETSLAVGPIARGCATVDDLTDTDQDGAPDQTTFTYTLPACHLTGYRGGTLDVTGVIVLSDPTPAAADFAYQVTVSTVAPLVWDASCSTERKIASGEIRLTLTSGGYVRLVWSGCGVDPTRSFVG